MFQGFTWWFCFRYTQCNVHIQLCVQGCEFDLLFLTCIVVDSESSDSSHHTPPSSSDKKDRSYLVASPSRKVLMRYVYNLLIAMQNATYQDNFLTDKLHHPLPVGCTVKYILCGAVWLSVRKGTKQVQTVLTFLQLLVIYTARKMLQLLLVLSFLYKAYLNKLKAVCMTQKKMEEHVHSDEDGK